MSTLTLTDSINKLESFQERLGYCFSDQGLLALALTHKSHSKLNNERLEFFGDATLKFHLSEFLYRTYPEDLEADLTTKRSSLENNQFLASVARGLGIGDVLKLGLGTRKEGGADSVSILAGAFEALLGAILIDGNKDALIETIHQHVLKDYETTLSSTEHPKTFLQEFLVREHQIYPQYSSQESSVGSEKVWEARCSIPELNLETSGRGQNIQQAETLAAERMLELLK